MKRAPHRGFTLIELLVVIGIIGLLATFAVVQLGESREKTRDAKRRADLRAMQKALELYYDANGTYPSTSGAWWGPTSAYGSRATSGTNGYVPNLSPSYIGILPVDPQPTMAAWPCTTLVQSTYLYISNGTDYKLLSHCGVEGSFPSANEPFYDPTRPTWGIMLCNQGGAGCAW